MPKCLKKYKDAEKMHNYKNRHRKASYAKGREYTINGKCQWTVEDMDKVLKHDKPDRELAKEIGRSVQAIQIMRSRIKAQEKDERDEQQRMDMYT